MISTAITLFKSLSLVGQLLLFGAAMLPIAGAVTWAWGEWQYHEGRVFERAEVARAAKRDAQQWAEWLVQQAVDDEEFAKALEAARLADRDAQKGIDRENRKAPSRGPFISAEFMRELDKLRP